MLTPHKIAERAATKLCGSPSHPGWYTEYGKVREFLRVRDAVREVEAEYKDRVHQDAMDAALGPHGQG